VANPSIEALDDVKVQVHTYDAEMGRTGGGVFNTTLKSGTNSCRWHRLLPDPAALGAANNYFGGEGRAAQAGSRSTTCPGGGFGGPIVQETDLLLVRRRRLQRRVDRGVSVVMPTSAMRMRRDFSR
jgi:hypothetical protein